AVPRPGPPHRASHAGGDPARLLPRGGQTVKRLALAPRSSGDPGVTALGGGLLSFALALLYVCVFPSVRDSFDQTQLPDWMQRMSGAAGSSPNTARHTASGL